MLERLSPARRNLALALLAVLFLGLAWRVRAVLNPLILGYLLAFVLHPLVRKLERRGWSRRTAVNTIFSISGIVFLGLSAGLYFQGRSLVRELSKEGGAFQHLDTVITEKTELLRERLETWGVLPETVLPPEGEEGVEDREDPTPSTDDVSPAHGEAEPAPVNAMQGLRGLLQDLVGAYGDEQVLAGTSKAGLRAAGGVWQVLRSIFGSILAFASLVLLLPIYSYFLLFQLEPIHAFIRRYLPVRDRKRLTTIGGQIGEVLANFFRGRLLVCLLKGLFLTAALLATGIPYAFLLGMGSGFLSLVPFFGPFLGAVTAALLGMLEYSFLGSIACIAAVFGAAELIEGYVLIPRILGNSLGMHPVVVLVAVMVGASALGVFGALIALPLAATAIILVRELVLPAVKAFADEQR